MKSAVLPMNFWPIIFCVFTLGLLVLLKVPAIKNKDKRGK
jgi:hypothetical protein